MIYFILKHLLFTLDPEKAHELSLKWLKILYQTGMGRYFPRPCAAPCKALGIEFNNPVGLAAGFDKNGDYLDALSVLGFGFIELGTVTPKPQDGNPFPRLFRLRQYDAVINRMGFNNKGVDYLVSKIKGASFPGVVGVNIGKNLFTPVDEAHKDYLYCLQKVYPHADYVVINISSPNTPGLRKLQLKEHLGVLLEHVKGQRNKLFRKYHKYVPLVVKIAPDLSESELFSFAEVFNEIKLDGIIATNTTLSREGVEASKISREPGGLSGAPLRKRAAHILKKLNDLLGGQTTLIASGGIMTAQDAVDRVQAGASLIQLYTGLIYSGPGLVNEAARKIRDM